jgi:hypothetical protein
VSTTASVLSPSRWSKSATLDAAGVLLAGPKRYADLKLFLDGADRTSLAPPAPPDRCPPRHSPGRHDRAAKHLPAHGARAHPRPDPSLVAWCHPCSPSRRRPFPRPQRGGAPYETSTRRGRSPNRRPAGRVTSGRWMASTPSWWSLAVRCCADQASTSSRRIDGHHQPVLTALPRASCRRARPSPQVSSAYLATGSHPSDADGDRVTSAVTPSWDGRAEAHDRVQIRAARVGPRTTGWQPRSN